jgi:hypothetical protein
MLPEPALRPRRQSAGMRGLRIAVLIADGLSLLAVLFIRIALPMNPGQDGEAQFWAGLLLAYALILLLGLALVLNISYLVALGLMHGRYDNGYSRFSQLLLVLLPSATALGLTVH